MDLSIVNNDYYLSGMAALIGDIDIDGHVT
jgi:hypothetical protein